MLVSSSRRASLHAIVIAIQLYGIEYIQLYGIEYIILVLGDLISVYKLLVAVVV
jgi:hypothetical protein